MVIWNDFCNTGTGLEFSGYTAWSEHLNKVATSNLQKGTSSMVHVKWWTSTGQSLWREHIRVQRNRTRCLYRVQAPNYDRWTTLRPSMGQYRAHKPMDWMQDFDRYVYLCHRWRYEHPRSTWKCLWKQHRIQSDSIPPWISCWSIQKVLDRRLCS